MSERATHVAVGVPCSSCDERGLQKWREASHLVGGRSHEVTGVCRECGGTKVAPRMISLEEFARLGAGTRSEPRPGSLRARVLVALDVDEDRSGEDVARRAGVGIDSVRAVLSKLVRDRAAVRTSRDRYRRCTAGCERLVAHRDAGES